MVFNGFLSDSKSEYNTFAVNHVAHTHIMQEPSPSHLVQISHPKNTYHILFITSNPVDQDLPEWRGTPQIY